MGELSKLAGTRWAGSAELWLDPLGDKTQRSDCTIEIDEGGELRYTWSYEGKPQSGRLSIKGVGAGDGIEFADTWHQSTPITCEPIDGARGLLQVEYGYGPDDSWGWRIGVFHREPSGELVVQMTNIAPWGEEVRAVRMIASKR